MQSYSEGNLRLCGLEGSRAYMGEIIEQVIEQLMAKCLNPKFDMYSFPL